MDKLRNKIERWQNYSIFVFVPAAAIAIFSDNILFETAAFIAGIVFATLIIVEKQLK